MTRPRTQPSTPRQVRRRVLRGASQSQVFDTVVELQGKTKREKQAAYSTVIARMRANAADPQIHLWGTLIDAATDTDAGAGGRPRANPTWALMLFMTCISVFKSASAVERMFADPDIWAIVCREVAVNLPPGTALPSRGPTRHHYLYFTRRLENHDVPMMRAFMELSTQRAREVGLADPDTARLSRADREHTMGVDAKVHSSPVGTLATETVDTTTGEIRLRRQDPARCSHREGGNSDFVYGTKVAYLSTRSREPGLRVILGLQHVPSGDGRGEAGAFVDLTLSAAAHLPGATHLVVDGALRGVHIADIQTKAGVQVIARTRKQDRKHGGVKFNDKYVPAKPLPASKARTKAFSECGGHDLWTEAGGISERILTADGTETSYRVERGQLKRQYKNDGSFQFLAQHRLPCGDTVHQWWEPLTPTEADLASGFNRCEHLRTLPADHPNFNRAYGMRSDTESYHAELERAFHHNRLPAYGVHRQMLVLLGAAISQNAWALHVFHREHQRQQAPPGQAA